MVLFIAAFVFVIVLTERYEFDTSTVAAGEKGRRISVVVYEKRRGLCCKRKREKKGAAGF